MLPCRRSPLVIVLVSLGLVLGCSVTTGEDGGSGSGGTPNVNGGSGGPPASGSGGRASAGGASGQVGGASASGGSSAGASASGGSSAGASASGGSSAGASASGGSSAGASASGGSSTTADPYGDARTRCVARTNELRASIGLPPIPRLAKAEPCADGQAKADSESGQAHSAFNACLDQVKWKGAGQNECPDYGSVEATLTKCLDAMWAEGPGGGHYDNMVGKSTHTACGLYTTPKGKVWLVEDFWTE